MEGGKEQNYWPGFVDALSNVVLTLVFVLVVFVFALMMASNKVAKKMQEVAAAEQAQKTGQAQLDKALSELEHLRSQETSSTSDAQSCLRFNKSDATQHAEIAEDKKSILIIFSPNAISVTDDTTKTVQGFIDSYRAANTGDARFIIESPEDPGAMSPLLAREAQLGRMLNVRNTLLADKVGAAAIAIRNIPAQDQKGSYNWVRVNVGR